MNDPTPHAAAHTAPRDPLAEAYHDAARAHVASLRSGTPLELLAAFRRVLVAEIALLRDAGGDLDQGCADQLGWELERVDLDLAARATPAATRQPSGRP
jgi:hypothetical protein